MLFMPMFFMTTMTTLAYCVIYINMYALIL